MPHQSLQPLTIVVQQGVLVAHLMHFTQMLSPLQSMQFRQYQQEQITAAVVREQLLCRQVVVQELITGMPLQLVGRVYQPQQLIRRQVFLLLQLIM